LAREVNGGTALFGILIQRAARADIMRYIGNRDPQPPIAIIESFGIDRVIKVSGIFAINGDERHISQVQPAFNGILRNGVTELFCLFE
jgi:hypothetical protein